MELFDDLQEEKEYEVRKYQQEAKKQIQIGKNNTNPYGAICRAEVWGIRIPETFSDIRIKKSLENTGLILDIQIQKYPFACGEIKAAYKARVRVSGSSSWTNAIVKEFIIPYMRTEQEYASQAENSAVAYFIASKYSETHSTSKRIRGSKSRVLKVADGGACTLFNYEEVLHGEFVKWTNNSGFINPEANIDLFRISKWSYEQSNFVMLTDMQGIETSSEIVLTDPAILCEDVSRFGPTNAPKYIPICMEQLERVITLKCKPKSTSRISKSETKSSRYDDDDDDEIRRRLLGLDPRTHMRDYTPSILPRRIEPPRSSTPYGCPPVSYGAPTSLGYRSPPGIPAIVDGRPVFIPPFLGPSYHPNFGWM